MARTKEAATAIGISADWLRRLERQGRIAPALRDVNNHRRYTTRDVERLRYLLFAGRHNGEVRAQKDSVVPPRRRRSR